MKVKTGIYGGSFNPVHKGHILLTRQFLKEAGLDEVWLVISPQNPLKEQAGLLPDRLRFHLLQLALRDEPHLKACDYEFRLPRPSYTWKTLQQMRLDFPDRDFTLLIGGDNWACFDRWYHHEDILSHFPVIVYPRAGYPVDEATLPQGVSLLHAHLIDISSTEIRRRIRNHEPIGPLVPAAVAREIARLGYYQ